MPKRIKAPSLKSVAEFHSAVDELARVSVELRNIESKRDARIQIVRDEFADYCSKLQEQRDTLLLAAEKYAEENRDAILPGKLKSSETTLAFFGFPVRKSYAQDPKQGVDLGSRARNA